MMTRSPAAKISIKAISDGRFVRSTDRWEPNCLITPWGDKISRVRVLATVVAKFVSEDKNYSTITLDDASDTISVRAFKEEREMLDAIKPGDMVDVVGKIKEYQEERYITPESIWRLDDPNWELVRRLELLAASRARAGQKGGSDIASGEVKVEKVPTVAVNAVAMPEADEIQVVEEVVEAAPKSKPIDAKPSKGDKETDKADGKKPMILKIIKDMDEGDGVKYITLLKESKMAEDSLDSVLDELMQDGEVYEPKIGRFKGV